MTVLVTGGSGFIGSFLVANLVQQGHKVVVPTRSVKDSWRLENQSGVVLVEGDIGQYAFQEGLFKEHKPQVVIHSAWDGMTRDKRDNPAQFNNLVTTEYLLRLSGEHKVSLFIGFGSQAEYGVYNKEITEDFAANPENLYGVYKLSAGLLGRWYARTHGFNFAWLRLFSSFGPKDWEGYFIPYIIRSFLSGETPKLTSCQQQWDYLYVKDIVRMVAKVMETKERFCDIYNFSSGQTVCLREVVQILKELTQTKAEPQLGVLPQPANGLMYLKGNNQKFEKAFGHVNLTPLREAFKETVEWYKNSYERA